jgi:cell division protein FtsZ
MVVMNMRFELKEEVSMQVAGMPVIKVMGLGGGGCNALDYMVRHEVLGVEFVAANTDAQALNRSLASVRLQLGKSGLGAGSNVEKGKQAAIEDIDSIRASLEGTQMLFVTAGMGGGTGTGSAPVVAKAAREMGILTVGVVTRPYSFENRDKAAESGIEELGQHVDSLIVIPNEKLKKIAGKNFTLKRAFDMANEVLHKAVQGVAEAITRDGFINVDFEDVRTVMGSRGLAMMGVGSAVGEERAVNAALQAISNPLLEDISMQGARGILVNVMGNEELGLEEYEQVGELVKKYAHPEAVVKVGLTFDDSLEDEVRVTIIATGLGPVSQVMKPVMKEQQPQPAVAQAAQPQVQPSRPAPQPAQPMGSRPQQQSGYATTQAPQANGRVAGRPVGLTPQGGDPRNSRTSGSQYSGNIGAIRHNVPGAIGAKNDGAGYLDIPAWIRRQAD